MPDTDPHLLITLHIERIEKTFQKLTNACIRHRNEPLLQFIRKTFRILIITINITKSVAYRCSVSKPTQEDWDYVNNLFHVQTAIMNDFRKVLLRNVHNNDEFQSRAEDSEVRTLKYRSKCFIKLKWITKDNDDLNGGFTLRYYQKEYYQNTVLQISPGFLRVLKEKRWLNFTAGGPQKWLWNFEKGLPTNTLILEWP